LPPFSIDRAVKIPLGVLAVFIALGMTQLPVRAAAQNPGAVAASVIVRDDVQQRLPSEGDSNPLTPQAPSRDDAPAPAGGLNIDPRLPLIIAAVVGLFWLVATVLQTVSGQRFRPSGREREEVTDSTGSRSPSKIANALAAADALAANGRYTEAIHELLAGAFSQLTPRHAEIPRAATSRELLQTLALPAVQRRALDDMVSRVERTWFAERPAAADDFAAVRTHFQLFDALAPSAS
jgi:hypothetical protein